MQLQISPNQYISELQREFNRMFPFLKLEFFIGRPSVKTGFSAKQLIQSSQKISKAQSASKDGVIDITDTMKVAELERKLNEEFNLAVQVFRKSGNLWLETTMTDNWTLLQQNDHGREISTTKPIKQKPEDYDLSRDPD
jgi:glycerol-3-phosphate O-acyltransferase